jgi:hypothetical protein
MRVLGFYLAGDIGQKKLRPFCFDGTAEAVMRKLREEVDARDEITVTKIEETA